MPTINATAFPTGVISQARLGAMIGSGSATAMTTRISVTSGINSVQAVLIFVAIPFSGVQTLAQLGTIVAIGQNFKSFLAPYIQNQIPEYIRNQYPAFVTFLQGYYTFLDSPGQANDLLLNASSWLDVDSTLDVFVDQIRMQLAGDFPSGTLLNARKFIKVVHEFYEAKGTEGAIELFFRIMYNADVNIDYPGNTVLRASDGHWRQDISIKLDTEGFSGNSTFVYFAEDYTVNETDPVLAYVLQKGNNTNPFDLIGVTATIQFLQTVPGSGIILRQIPVNILDAKKTANILLFDLTVDIDPATVILDGASLWFNNLEYGLLTRQLLSYQILDPGQGFNRGDLLFVNELGGTGPYFADSSYTQGTYVAESPINGAIMRVTSIDSNTGVLSADIVNTGVLFLSDQFDIALSSSTSTTPTNIQFNTGFIYKRPGYFLDSSGLLSDACKLQDNDFYQAYSYVLKSEIDPSIWVDSYKKIVHPAGVKMFSEFIISDNANIRGVYDVESEFIISGALSAEASPNGVSGQARVNPSTAANLTGSGFSPFTPLWYIGNRAPNHINPNSGFSPFIPLWYLGGLK